MFLLFRPNIPLSTLFSNALNLCSPLNVRDQVSHPYKAVKIIALYTLMLSVSDICWEEKRSLEVKVSMHSPDLICFYFLNE